MDRKEREQTNNFEYRKIGIAEKRREDGDLVGAITVLRNLEDDKTKNIEVYALIAAVYFDMELYELSLEYWFRYLAASDAVKVKAKAYSGIAACFCMMGDIRSMGYYIELGSPLSVKGEPEYEKVIMDYYDYVCDSLGPQYYVSYPTENIPAKRSMFEADSLLDEHKTAEAVEKLAQIPKNDEYYCEAQMKIAKCFYTLDRKEEAEKVLSDLIDEFPDDAFANMGYGFERLDNGDEDGARYYLKKAAKGVLFDEEDYFKIAFTLCRLGAEEDAFYPIEKAFEINEYYLNGILLYGQLNYNRGDFPTAAKYFKKFYHLTRNVVAAFFLDLAEKQVGGNIGYSYNPPQAISKFKGERIIDIIEDKKSELKKYSEEDIEDLIEWSMLFNEDLCNDFISVIMEQGSARTRNYLINKMLSFDMPTDAKLKVVEELIMRDYNKKVAFSVENSFVKIQLINADFEKTQGALFKRAFAFAASRTCAFTSDLTKLRDAAYKIYYEIKDAGALKKVSDINALGCVMALKSGFKIGDKSIYDVFFKTNKKAVKKILDILECETL